MTTGNDGQLTLACELFICEFVAEQVSPAGVAGKVYFVISFLKFPRGNL